MKSSKVIELIKETIEASPIRGRKQEKQVVLSASLYEHFNLPDRLFVSGVRIIKMQGWDYA